ncbi:hypothetical protein FB451DRAFT_174781 [Mycena latifolia]|nr:hypothetical protein FB451DRAFT_174781 [Mycena latifolia]
MLTTLPTELIELIVSPLDKRDLWALTRVCFRLRSLTLFRFLARYNISEKEIRLEVMRGRFATAGPGILPSALSAVPPPPDIVLHNSYGQFKNRAGMAKMLAAAAHGPTPTLVFIGRGTVTVSPPQERRPIDWKWVPHPTMLTSSSVTLPHFIADCLFLVALALAYILCGVVNMGVAATWIYRYFFRARWDLEQRIAADLGEIYTPSMHVQSLLPGTPQQCTLVTFGGNNSARLTIPRLSALTNTQRSALLATLELPTSVVQLTIPEGANHNLADVMSCVRRHPQLTALIFEPRSLSPGSVGDLPVHIAGRITAVTAPAAYIPSILQAEPNVTHLSITFPPTPPNHSASDIPTVLRTLKAVASLPADDISLTLSFAKTSTLPWHVQDLSIPIPRVTSLSLLTAPPPDVALLARWVAACFPTLSNLNVPGVEAEVLQNTQEAA